MSRAQAQYTFQTIGGIGTQAGNINGTGGSVVLGTQFNRPFSLVATSDGTLYVTDNGNGLIRKITSAGVVSTFAGTVGSIGENNGTTADPKVSFNLPQGIAADSSGNLYVADYGGATIRKITPAGVVTTLAGTAGTTGYADGKGTAAKFNQPSSVAVDSSGNVYVADSGNLVIRKITSDGTVTTLAGSANKPGFANGKGLDAGFRNPRGLAIDSGGNLYVADTGNNMIRKITSDGTVTTLAGLNDTDGSADGTGADARFSFPNGLAVDSSGNIYVADENNAVIRKITPAGVVTTLAGLTRASGRVDGQGQMARFDHPTSVAVGSNGVLYVADYGNQLIRKVTADGVVTTIAGSGGVPGLLNGTGFLLNPTLFQNPTHPVVDNAGNLYLTDTGNHSIRKIASDGTVSLVAGSAFSMSGNVDGTGANALFNIPTGLARDSAGNLYVADTGNQRIRKVSPGGVVTTYAGLLLVPGNVDGGTDVATFNLPSGVAVDAAGNVYVADYSNHTIRKITPDGNVSTLAGAAKQSGSADGTGGAARFNYPRDVAVDAAGNVFVADFGNHTIRKIAPGGIVTTVAGSPEVTGSADGTGSAARFNGPSSVAVDTVGNLYVTDSNNNTIRLISPAGAVSTIGGSAGVVGSADGVGSIARFNHPAGITVDAGGNVYVGDNRNNTIRGGYINGGSGAGGGSGSGSGSGGSGSGGSGSGGSGSGGSGGTGGSSGGSGGSSGGIDPGSSGAFDDSTTGTGFVLHPGGLATDASGNTYVCDSGHHCIMKIDANAVITVFAGQSGTSGTADGTGAAARFNNPVAIASDGSSNLYVADTGNATIRMITSAGVVTTLAGSAGQTGTTDGTGSAARFNSPMGVTVNISAGDVYVADTINNTIRKVTSAGVVTTFAGTAGTVGDDNGVSGAARFNHPTGLTFDVSGNLLVADTYNNTIRSIRSVDITSIDAAGVVTVTAPAGTVTTLAGSAGVAGAFDGRGEYALFNQPMGLSTSSDGYIYVADSGNSCIRRLTTAGYVNTIAGLSTASGRRNGAGEQALFNQPQAVVAIGTNTAIVSDTGNSVLRVIVIPSAASYNSIVATVALTASTSSSSGSTTGSTTGSTGYSGGGGAPSTWFLAGLGALAAMRRLTGRKKT